MDLTKNNKNKHFNYMKLALEQAKINLGSTGNNPSVGCVVEKNGSIISSGHTSLKGRPHAEFNALNRKLDFKDATLYVTLEPCSHHGMTPPCTNLIIKKKLKRVYFYEKDFNKISTNLTKKLLNKKKISLIHLPNIKKKDLYKSYKLKYSKHLPYIDAKIAISKDFFTKNKKIKWLTNLDSRKRAHLIRSKYDAIISSSKSINTDDSILNCRINGLEAKSPDLVIIDRHLKLRKNLKLFKKTFLRKIILITCSSNIKKIFFLKKKGVIVIRQKKLYNFNDFKSLFLILKKRGYSRFLLESGVAMLNSFIRFKLIHKLYMFKSNVHLKKNGSNLFNKTVIRKNKISKIKVNLHEDNLYEVIFKNV